MYVIGSRYVRAERTPQWVASGFPEKAAALELPPAITVVKSQGPHTFQSWTLYSGNRSPMSCRDNKQTLQAKLGQSASREHMKNCIVPSSTHTLSLMQIQPSLHIQTTN